MHASMSCVCGVYVCMYACMSYVCGVYVCMYVLCMWRVCGYVRLYVVYLCVCMCECVNVLCMCMCMCECLMYVVCMSEWMCIYVCMQVAVCDYPVCGDIAGNSRGDMDDISAGEVQNSPLEKESAAPEAECANGVGECEPEWHEQHPRLEIHAAQQRPCHDDDSNGRKHELEVD